MAQIIAHNNSKIIIGDFNIIEENVIIENTSQDGTMLIGRYNLFESGAEI